MRIEEQARGLVIGPRQDSYGSPAVNHTRTAILWNAYLMAKYGDAQVSITAEDVCELNVLQKLSRDMNVPDRENNIDRIGFLLNVDMMRHPDSQERDD